MRFGVYFKLLIHLLFLVLSFQSFRFVEHPAFQGFISYLNPKIGNELILKKSCMENAVNTRVGQLEDLTIELIGVRILFISLQCSYLFRLLNLKSALSGMAGRHAIAAHIPHLALFIYIHQLTMTISGC